MTDCILVDLAHQRRFEFKVNGHQPTFRLRTERISAAAVRDLDDEVQDLLDVAAAVFFADSEIMRGGATRPDMGADWHRHLRLTIPVRRPDLWSRTEVLDALSSAVGFLTGDDFDFEFTKSDDFRAGSGFLNLDPTAGAFKADKVMMFSGGLDSFSGALESLATESGNVILVSHQSAPKVAARQKDLAEYLIQRFPGRVRHIMVPAHRAGAETRDTTQRSRSFLFAAMGSAIASTFGAATLSFFENGIVSHNLPVSPQIVGTMASRTTHPLSLSRIQSLLDLVLRQGPRITNPYEWMTKTEVVERIQRHGGEKKIEAAVSCTRVRDQTTLHTHCGSCSQCLDRRFAILAARLGDADSTSRYETDVMLGSREIGTSMLPVEWTKHFLQIKQMGEASFLARFGTELARIIEAFPTATSDDLFKRVLDLHRRQAQIVVQVLTSEVERNSGALASGSLASSCLLVLHVAQSAVLPMPVVARDPIFSVLPDDDDDWETAPQPGQPLTLSFEELEGKPIVRVMGLCRFTHKLAKATIELGKQHVTDRAEGLPSERFRYIHLAYVGALDISKGEARALIARGRKQFARAYRDQHDVAPPPNLLFQNKPSKGYRLNPRTRVRSVS